MTRQYMSRAPGLCGSLAGAALASTAPAQPCNQMTLVASPNGGAEANVLRGVATLSATDVWAVGHYRVGALDLPLSMHWDGAAWSLVAMPTPPSLGGTPHVTLHDARAFSPGAVWAVGSNTPPSSTAVETLVYRWNGSSWSIVPSPAGCCGSFGSTFYCVDGVAADDFWAVGYMANPVAGSCFAAHWDGSSWTEHDLPISTGTLQGLTDLHVIASDDIWALEGVGFAVPSAPRRIFHWDGSSWSEGAPPISGVLYLAAHAIFALGPDDIWVPSVRVSSFQIVMLHFDGSTWTEMSVPLFASEIFGSGPGDLYAAGDAAVMHWDGAAWTLVDSLDGMPDGSCFDAEIAGGVIWCAGNTQPGPLSATLTARFPLCAETLAGDVDGDGAVNVSDLVEVVNAWGACPPSSGCPADIAPPGGNGAVDVGDLLMVIVNWT